MMTMTRSRTQCALPDDCVITVGFHLSGLALPTWLTVKGSKGTTDGSATDAPIGESTERASKEGYLALTNDIITDPEQSQLKSQPSAQS